MTNKLLLSEEVSEKLRELSKKLGLRRNIVCRIAVGRSLKEGYLFSLNYSNHKKHLEEETLSSKLKEEFEKKGHGLNKQAKISNNDGAWWIKRGGKEKYRIEKTDEELKVYKVGKMLTDDGDIQKTTLDDFDFGFDDSNGYEFNRYTLTGEYDDYFKAMIVQAEGKSMSDEEFFTKYLRKHIERGIELMYKEYQRVGSKYTYLSKLADGEKVVEMK